MLKTVLLSLQYILLLLVGTSHKRVSKNCPVGTFNIGPLANRIHKAPVSWYLCREKSWCRFVTWRENIGSQTDGFPLLLCGASVLNVCFPHQRRFGTPALPPCFRTTEEQQQHAEASRPCSTSCFLLRYKDLPDTTRLQNTLPLNLSFIPSLLTHLHTRFPRSMKLEKKHRQWRRD